MKNRTKIICAGIIVTFIIGASSISNGLAANNTPGSASDPLVTKSYVDDRINQITALLSASGAQNVQPTMRPDGLSQETAEIVNLVLAQLEYLNSMSGENGAGGLGSVYKPVFAFAGQFVVGDEGSEIILRSGKATGYCPGENGLVNMTTGSEIYNGNEVSINHLVIVSRSDGRGMRATTDAWFLVRGGYKIYS